MYPLSILILGLLAEAEKHNPDFIIGTAVGQGALLLTYVIREWFKERDKKRIRQWDVEDRERSRTLIAQKAEETTREIKEEVQKVVPVKETLESIQHHYDTLVEAALPEEAKRAREKSGSTSGLNPPPDKQER